MHRKYFPKCKVEGDTSPSLNTKRHMSFKYAIPRKCEDCQFSFEGSCTRGLELTGSYLEYDYGSCGIEGKSEPKPIKVLSNGVKILVPQKCVDCKFIHYNKFLREYRCTKDQDLWGEFGRGLDWGDWEPECPNMGLRSSVYNEEILKYFGHVVITKEVIEYILKGQKIKALKIYRSLNEIPTIKQAREGIDEIEKKLRKALDKA